MSAARGRDGRGGAGRTRALLLAAAAMVATGCGDGGGGGRPVAPPPGAAGARTADAGRARPPGAPSAPAADPALLARGATLYAAQCAPCHGEGGGGDGPLAVFLMPRPRDFTAARYRVTSTRNQRPTDEDLLRTLRVGFPGTPMPAFAHLPEADLRALVAVVKGFAATPIVAAADPEDPDNTGPLPIPAEPADGPASVARGLELYGQACAPCHGPTGRGDGAQEQFDDRGMPVRPRNFASGAFKGGGEGRDLYLRIVGGLGGSPMPGFAMFAGDDAWHLVHFVQSVAGDAAAASRGTARTEMAARRIGGEAPLDPADPAWAGAVETSLSLMPLWVREGPRVPSVRVAALHDGRRIALRLLWDDPTRDASTMGQEEFRDGVAVQWSALPEPPFFGMGDRAGAVDTWMWKADRQEDGASPPDLRRRFPDMAADGWPAGFTNDGLVVPDLPLSKHHVLFLTGRAAGNGVSDLDGGSPAESLRARGPGTLGFRRGGAAVEARGAWKDGRWAVVLRRTLEDGGDGVAFAPGARVSVGIAVWNGSDGDRNGIKSVTPWHGMTLEERP